MLARADVKGSWQKQTPTVSAHVATYTDLGRFMQDCMPINRLGVEFEIIHKEDSWTIKIGFTHREMWEDPELCGSLPACR
jgi:hypothetical protein